MNPSALQSERFEVDDELWAAQTYFEEKGWTDGLPIVPPTEERVVQMLAAAQRGHTPPSGGAGTGRVRSTGLACRRPCEGRLT